MNSFDLETQIAGPIQNLGMQFYFDPATAEAGKALDLNVYEFYGVGRGGVLGDVDADAVTEAFWFFKPSVVAMMWAASAKGNPSDIARAHIAAAYVYADKTFANVDAAVTEPMAYAARLVVNAVRAGRYALFDGYRGMLISTDPRRNAYQALICLRELRGGAHIDATRAEGLTAAEACYVSNEMIFKLHGYSDEDIPTDPEPLRKQLAHAEEETTRVMAGYLDVLKESQREDLAAGVAAFNAQLAAK